MRHPEQLAALRADPARIPAAVEELLRYDAPVPHSTFRYAIEPIELGGVDDPGRRAGHHLPGRGQPRRRPLPDRRRRSTSTAPTRATSPSGTASTSASARRWPGWKGSSRSTTLLDRFPELRLAVPVEELHWGHGDGLVLRGLSELPVIPGPDAGSA